MSQEAYEALIHEAFIEPIRSVLIVDDDYPTLHDTLTHPDAWDERQKAKFWVNNRDNVKRVIEQFRKEAAPLMLDIHDGHDPDADKDEKEVRNLQQTDLLVLDYELEKPANGGKKAVSIARNVIENDHFNLVLVHTRKLGLEVFEEFLLGFLTPIFQDHPDRQPEEDAVIECLDELGGRLADNVDLRTYQAARKDIDAGRRINFHNDNEWASIRAILEEGLEESEIHKKHWKAIGLELLARYEDNKRALFHNGRPGPIKWRIDSPMYIQADRGFIAFTEKSYHTDLLGELYSALKTWSPMPARLMLTKLRAVMNERGIEIQDQQVSSPEVGAVWYENILRADDHMTNGLVDRTIRNHSEQLLDKIIPNVSEFVGKMAEADKDAPSAINAVNSRYNVALDQRKDRCRGVLGHNVFVCSKPPSDGQVEIGHVFTIDDEYWICLTPACDLVPSQANREMALLPKEGSNDGYRRISLVKLEEKSVVRGLVDATSGIHLFMNPVGGDKSICLTDLPDSGSTSPVWTISYVDKKGRLLSDGEATKCSLMMIVNEASGPSWQEREALMVGQIRYEYALNLQSRLVASQSRIGLDFQSTQ